ncbi:hypothetical protein KY320_01805 [Candidatus Woesearchaeota archaeon]|nr:hypothetical protein [Candidatus Woesearchaeota archaeon]
MEEKQVKVRAILEVVGKPKEHVDKSIKLVIDTVRNVQGMKVEQAKVFKVKPVDNYFSSFAELELSFADTTKLVDFCFDYLPSSVEVIEPAKLELDSTAFAETLNDLLARLHGINANLANINAENRLLKMNATGLLKNLFILSLKNRPATIEELSKRIGIKETELKPFIDSYIKQGKIKKANDKYELVESMY